MSSIIAPFGEPIEARPPVPTEEERLAEKAARKRIKDERRASRGLSESIERGAQKGTDEA